MFAIANAGGIERATDDLVADAWQILNAAAADEHDRVLLQVVAFAWDVSGYFGAAGDAYTGNLAQR